MLLLSEIGFFIPIIMDILTDSVMTNEFHLDFPNISAMGVFLIHLGGARVIVDIIFNKNDTNLFDRIKTLVKEYWPYIRKNIFSSIIIAITAFVSIMLFSNILSWCLGITASTSSFFSLYIYDITKVILCKKI